MSETGVSNRERNRRRRVEGRVAVLTSVLTCEPGCACGDPTLCGTRTPYVYAWGNNARRAELKGRRCVIEATGAMGTVLVVFLDTGERVTTSRRALRRI